MRRFIDMAYTGRVLVFGILLSMVAGGTLAQKDTTIMMDEITVTGSKLIETKGLDHIITVDTSEQIWALDGSMTTLLGTQSGMYFRSYQQGGLATLSFRGATAAQTAVLWHGFNINNAMNGLTNFGNISSSLVDDITIIKSGNAAHWGSGTIGGSIHLNTFHPQTTSQMTAQLTYGEYGFLSANASYNARIKRHNFQVKGNWQDAENTFPYKAVTGETRILTHSGSQSIAWMLDDAIRLSERSKLSLHLWYQANEVQIPATLLETISKAEQKDKTLRSLLQWKYTSTKGVFRLAFAFFDERQWYNDTNIKLSAQHLLSSYNLDAEFKRPISNGDLVVSANSNYLRANSANYATIQHQQRSNLVMSVSQIYGRITTKGSVRIDHISEIGNAFTFHFGAAHRLQKWMWLRAEVDKVFRAPTLNDIYWVPGGNRDLKPEFGYAQQLGLQIKPTFDRWQLDHTTSLFNRNIHDWIQWTPTGSVWSPQNLLHVWSRGYETETAMGKPIKNGKWTAMLSTAYILSTNQKSNIVRDNTLGKQLIYMPKFQSAFRVRLEWKSWGITGMHQFVGYRYVSSDHSTYLEPYHLLHTMVHYQCKRYKKLPQVMILFKIDNILDTHYQAVVNRPMVGRQWFGSLKFTI
ncbi:MAG: TonB-dependent receptor [Saprospiraceae bacterium]